MMQSNRICVRLSSFVVVLGVAGAWGLGFRVQGGVWGFRGLGFRVWVQGRKI